MTSEDTYRTQQHLHVDLGGHVDVVQFTCAIAMDDVHQGIHCGFNVSQAYNTNSKMGQNE